MKAKRFNYFLQKDLYEELICGYVSFTADGSILSVNKTMANWIGISYADLKNRNFKLLMTDASRLYYDMVVETMLTLNHAVTDINLQFNAKDGYFDALLTAESYTNKEGKVFLVNATLQKVSEQKKFENELVLEKRYAERERRKFEFLFNLSPTQLWTTDHLGRILTMNQKVKDYFGISRPVDEYGLSGVYSPDRIRALTAWKRRITIGKKFERELRLQAEDTEPEWFVVTAEPYHNTAGVLEMWLCSATNINKQKLLQIASQEELQNNLQSAYQTLDRNSELFVSFAMNQSHVIRKPLANILGLVQLAAHEEVNDSMKNILELLMKSAAELDETIKSGHTFPTLPDLG